jgi:GT2 family glycosyltransferase
MESLDKQTFQDFEWIVVSEQEVDVPYIPAPPKKALSNLNASLNEGLRHCNGDYVVFYQDFIPLPEDCFEKLVEAANSKTFVTTVTKNPEGQPDDPRYLGLDTVRPCQPAEWEANVAIAPMEAIKQLGGFDEEYDKGWSWDNVNLAERAAMLGFKFLADESNRPVLIDHPKETDMELNAERHYATMEAIRRGDRPIKLDYLV